MVLQVDYKRRFWLTALRLKRKVNGKPNSLLYQVLVPVSARRLLFRPEVLGTELGVQLALAVVMNQGE